MQQPNINQLPNQTQNTQQTQNAPRSQQELMGANFANLRNKDEFLKRSRTSAPTNKNFEDVTLLSQRNQCQQCKVLYTNDDFSTKRYRTCFICKERSVCRTHLENFKGLTTKCELCMNVYIKMQDFILPPQTKEEVKLEELRNQQAFNKIQDIDNRVNQHYQNQQRNSDPIYDQSSNLGPSDTNQNNYNQAQYEQVQRKVQQQVQSEMRQIQEQREAQEKLEEQQWQLQEAQRQQQLENQRIALQQQRQQAPQNQDQAYMEEKKTELYQTTSLSSWFWTFAVLVIFGLIIIQAEIFHANLIPQDQKLIIYKSRYENYKNGFKNYFSTHSITQSQDLSENYSKVKALFHVLDREQGNQYQLSLDQIKEEINQHIFELEFMYKQFPEETTSQDVQYQQLAIQELRKFQNYIDKEQFLRRRY